MSTQEMTSTNNVQGLSTASAKEQYTIWQILGIWLAAGAPMWFISWVVYPAMSAGLPAMDAGLLRMNLLAVGLIWEFVLAMIILYREEGNIRLSTISRRVIQGGFENFPNLLVILRTDCAERLIHSGPPRTPIAAAAAKTQKSHL